MNRRAQILVDQGEVRNHKLDWEVRPGRQLGGMLTKQTQGQPRGEPPEAEQDVQEERGDNISAGGRVSIEGVQNLPL